MSENAGVAKRTVLDPSEREQGDGSRPKNPPSDKPLTADQSTLQLQNVRQMYKDWQGTQDRDRETVSPVVPPPTIAEAHSVSLSPSKVSPDDLVVAKKTPLAVPDLLQRKKGDGSRPQKPPSDKPLTTDESLLQKVPSMREMYKHWPHGQGTQDKRRDRETVTPVVAPPPTIAEAHSVSLSPSKVSPDDSVVSTSNGQVVLPAHDHTLSPQVQEIAQDESELLPGQVVPECEETEAPSHGQLVLPCDLFSSDHERLEDVEWTAPVQEMQAGHRDSELCTNKSTQPPWNHGVQNMGVFAMYIHQRPPTHSLPHSDVPPHLHMGSTTHAAANQPPLSRPRYPVQVRPPPQPLGPTTCRPLKHPVPEKCIHGQHRFHTPIASSSTQSHRLAPQRQQLSVPLVQLFHQKTKFLVHSRSLRLITPFRAK